MDTKREKPIERVRAALALGAALKATLAGYENTPLAGRDLIYVWNLLPKWPAVTAAYSGLEQTLKLMASEARGWDLTNPKRPWRGYGHDLAGAYEQIGQKKRDLVEACWKDYMANCSPYRKPHQHEHVRRTAETAEKYLDYLSDEAQYQDWRYLPLERSREGVSDTCPVLMIELWNILLCAEQRNRDCILYRTCAKESEWSRRGPLRICLREPRCPRGNCRAEAGSEEAR